MLTIIIALLISIGAISSADSYESLTTQEKEEILLRNDIIITDYMGW